MPYADKGQICLTGMFVSVECFKDNSALPRVDNNKQTVA